MSEKTPVFDLRDDFEAESYWPEDYVAEAAPVLERFGWLTRPLAPADIEAAAAALDGLNNLSLDQDDVYPFGLLWALRSTGAVGEVDGLDAQLAGWREWEETDHLAHLGDRDPLGFLPVLQPDDAWSRMMRRHERERAEMDLRHAEQAIVTAEALGYRTQARAYRVKADAARARLNPT